MENRDENSIKYDAFISYRHCELDQYVAVTLQKKLENFKLPKSALPKVKGEKTKITRVFRDEDELMLSDNLSEPIDYALANSEFLIVVCSPRLSLSKWCLREIETFLKAHDRKHILLVLAEGEPSESFPEILCYEDVEITDENGNSYIKRSDLEPLAADVRGTSKKEINRAIDAAIIKIAAAIFGLNYDDLRQRHREQRLKKIFAIWSAITAVVLIFAIICLGLLTIILQQRNDIKDRYAGTVAEAAEGLLEAGRNKGAIYALRSVLDINEPYNADAYRQLTKALDLYALGEEYIPLNYFSIPSIISNFKLSANNNYIVIGGNYGDYYVIDIKENKIIYSFEAMQNSMALSDFAFDGEKGIIYTQNDSVIYANFLENNKKILYETRGIVLSDAKSDIACVLADGKFAGYKNGELLYETNLKSYSFIFDELDCDWYGYSPDGKHVLLSIFDNNDSWLLQFNLANGEVELVYNANDYNNASYATDGRKVYITQNNYSENSLPIDSRLCVIDIYNLENTKIFNIPLTYTKSIILCDIGICITTDNSAIMLDENDYNIIDKTEGISYIVAAFQYKSGIGIVDINGSFYIFDNEFINGVNYTIDLFGIVPHNTLRNVIFQNDKFYYFFADNYIVEYVDNPRAVKETESFREFDYYDDLLNGVPAEDVLDKINDIDSAYVYTSVYSNDKKHIAVMMCDKTLRIYNGDTFELEKVEYGVDSTILISLTHIEEADIYILNTGTYSYILDSKFNYISDIDFCVGFEDGCFIVIYRDEYYKLKMLSFEEILQLADKELEGYIPDEVIMDKYIVKYNIK